MATLEHSGAIMKLMRKLYVAAVLCLAAPFFVRAAEVVLMEESVAKVNGDIITSSELNDDKKAVEEELSKQGLTGAELERIWFEIVKIKKQARG